MPESAAKSWGPRNDGWRSPCGHASTMFPPSHCTMPIDRRRSAPGDERAEHEQRVGAAADEQRHRRGEDRVQAELDGRDGVRLPRVRS